MKMFDLHPHIIAWQSEGVSIPYKNPLTRRHTVYIPDFLIVYEKNGKKLVDMLEVKPAKEVPGMLAEGKRRLTAKDKLAQAINAAKWQAAIAYCAKRGVRFRVMTEHELFGKSSRR